MRQRVRWQDPLIRHRNIDQTRLMIDDGASDHPDFSFLVIGDSGSGDHQNQNPQRQVASLMVPHLQDCRFTLHTGDVIYLVGSSEFYRKNFIEPYREWFRANSSDQRVVYDRMCFQFPILPVLGNHDYYDLPFLWGMLSGVTIPLRNLLQSKLDLDVGWHGSWEGDAYARAFLDYLKALIRPGELARHLDKHYTATVEGVRCLRYQPGEFTRLPNRYYQFRYGNIDFFALDSNTFNAPEPLPNTQQGLQYREFLEHQRQEIQLKKRQILEESATLNKDVPADADELESLHTRLSQLDEVEADIDKQLSAQGVPVVDTEQLNWLKQRLIDSWNNPSVHGRILYFHHPPYVTETSKWQQSQTLAVRDRLRQVLDEAAKILGEETQGRPLVDLVFTGHAHCLEHLETLDTGHGDARIHWIVCGGSGFSLRRQRLEGPDLLEDGLNALQLNEQTSGTRKENGSTKVIARSHLYIGRNGHGSEKRRPYSCLRVDVKDGNPPKYVIRPMIAERYQRRWLRYEAPTFTV